MKITQKNSASRSRRMVMLVLGFVLLAATPVAAAIIVQNFTEYQTVVADPPIVKEQGADADYDGDGDDTTGYLTVDLGQTITNNDDGSVATAGEAGTAGGTDTLLSHEEITFTCFRGDRTYYTDVLRLRNTTGTENWDITLRVETDVEGNPAVEDTFAAGSADIWLMTSQEDVTAASPTETPNPNSYGALNEWLDNFAGTGSADASDAIELEVIAGVLSAKTATTGPFTIAGGEERQLALVVDCGSDMVNGETGTFRVTVEATPA